MAGFGGVAEYGITVRWNKNFLKLIRLLLERRGAVQHVRRRAFRRHHDCRQHFRNGIRSRGAVRRRRPSDRDPHEERSGARSAAGVRFPDGAAAHRRGQDQLGRESATPIADRGDRRRPDRHRYGHRIAGVLRGAGREIPGALRNAGRRKGRARSARGLDRGRNRNGRRVSETCVRHSRRAGVSGSRRPRSEAGGTAQHLGRRHHRLPPPDDRCAQLYAEPRRGRSWRSKRESASRNR